MYSADLQPHFIGHQEYRNYCNLKKEFKKINEIYLIYKILISFDV